MRGDARQVRGELLKIPPSRPFSLNLEVNKMRGIWGMRVKCFPPFPFPPFHLIF